MSTPDLNPILEDLAAGRIDAAEAARRIEALKSATTPAEGWQQPPTATPKHAAPGEPTNEQLRDTEGWESGRRQYAPHASEAFADDVDPEPVDEVPQARRRQAPQGKGVDRISVHAVGRRVRIVGDYSVATVAAEGPHVLRRNGSVLEVSSDGEIGPSLDGFSMLRPPRNLDDIRAMSLGKELYLRVNPGIIVDVEVTAGSLATEKLPYLGKVRVTAGGATMSGVAEANDVLVQAGQATLKGSIRTGRSRVRVESGSLNVALDDDSDVTVRAESQLGKVTWSGSLAGAGSLDEAVVGNGSARLDVSVVMGLASVRLGEDDAS